MFPLDTRLADIKYAEHMERLRRADQARWTDEWLVIVKAGRSPTVSRRWQTMPGAGFIERRLFSGIRALLAVSRKEWLLFRRYPGRLGNLQDR